MYFMSRSTMVCRIAAPFPSLYRYALTCVVLFGVGCGWYKGIYIPFESTITYKHVLIEQGSSRKRFDSVQTALETDIEVLRTTLHNYNSAWKSKGIEVLLSSIAQAGLALVTCDTSVKQIESWCSQDVVAIHAIGSLENISQFLSMLLASDVAFEGNTVDITVVDGNHYNVRLSLVVSTTCAYK